MAYSDPKSWRKTYLQVIDVNGSVIRQIDLTDVPNANAQCTLTIRVIQKCDMLHDHIVTGPINTQPWGYD